MKSRSFKLLSAIQDYLIKYNEKNISGTSHEYRCPKCGLVLTFNRNQPSVECPNDGTRMIRVSD